ncbi:Cytosolic iron-sulfur protein assembly protein [Cadophora gregata]|uniref:Cytosolic iron-sulfur protein assembly protein n=1 Tax=Cadophora gregata TaxID=51156 RepID=UPI0026DB2BB1|nr:Cytosolic iron-sulfur protein assembly protein [Cadophora gregata]KAK0107213.1 Cytosolic iron-sulfur protein assembly protein [Cadophora gregata]
MASSTHVRIIPLADFKPISSSRAWVSIPNPNGLPLIATATSDKTARVYSLKNFTLHSTLEGGHARSVRSVAWKPVTKNTGTLCLATGSFDATMGIWRRSEESFAGREEEKETHTAPEDEDAIEVEITSDGAAKPVPRLIQGDESETEDDWEFAIVLEGHDSEVKTVAYSPSGQWLASCSRDKSIWVWEEIGEEGEDEFETVAVLQEHTADVKYVCWRKDDGNGEVLASASYDDTIRFWRGDDEGEWSCIAVLEGHEGTVWSLDWEPEASQKNFESESPQQPDDFSPRIPRLISASADCTIRVWTQAPAPPPPNKPSYFNTGIPSTMRAPPSNETWDCTAILPKVHTLPIYAVNWSTKSGRVVSTGGDGKIAIYEERTKGRSSVGGAIEREWVVLGVLEGGHGPYEINHVAWCQRFDVGRKEAGEEMVISSGDDGVVRAWALEDVPAPTTTLLTVTS